jgi:hypothetical protein
MRDRYPPHGHNQEWPGASPSRRDIPPLSDPTLRFDEPAGGSRSQGLRRLSRLTWRTTQLSAIAAAAFAVLFARSAPAHTASSQTVVKPPATASPTASPTPTSTHAARKHKARKTPPSAQASPAATQPAAPPPSPTLAPPSTPPAPTPAASPVQSTSSGSTGGG